MECFWITTFDSLRDTSFVVCENDRALLPDSDGGEVRHDTRIRFKEAMEGEAGRCKTLRGGFLALANPGRGPQVCSGSGPSAE